MYLIVMSQKLDYDSLSFVISSNYRKTVIEALSKQSQTPSEINSCSGEPGIAHVSRALQELREKQIVNLLVSEDTQKGRIYGLTEEGAAVAEELKERE
jgi:predicted transcriptional regulator